MTLVIMT